VGVRRWQPPRPAPDWTTVRDARHFSPQCVQQPYPEQSLFARPDRPQSEDCLYLNVWTRQAPGADAPVMVWIHGGGLTRGTGATPSYDGGELAKKGAVVVTLNYRLGPFGFLSHPALSAESAEGVSGNQGYLDQIAALEWVRAHIEAFGGDPERVTIFGESAGSRSVHALMVTPASKGLFHRAIGQSGAGFSPSPRLKQPVHSLPPAEESGTKLEAELGVDDLEGLRAAPAHAVLAAAAELDLRSTTVVDGRVIPDQPATLFAAGRQHPVPVIVGFNKDEGTSLTAPAARAREPEAWVRDVRAEYGDRAPDVLGVYPSDTPEQSWLRVFRDRYFGREMVRWADGMASVDRPAWMYFFSFHPSVDALGAYHAGEIRYVFGNDQLIPDADAADRRLADLMSSFWVRFAATGDPNATGLPDWQRWDPERMNYLEFGNEPRAGEDLIREADALFDSMDPAMLVRD
jgi:para-nitrobenzyl esterase